MHQALRFLTTNRTFTALLLTSVLSGCALPPHNNTLVFAVNRKIGLDINPTNAANAGLTIGYSSNEFAYVPLWANGPDGKPLAECQRQLQHTKSTTTTVSITTTVETPINCSDKPKFQGQDAEGKGNGSDDDAYSVFASFGGRAGGGTQTGDVNGSLQVASFFATGIAAQNLAERADGRALVGLETNKEKISNNSEAIKAVNGFLNDTADKSKKIDSTCLKKLQTDFQAIVTSEIDFMPMQQFSTKKAAQWLVDLVEEKSASAGVKRLSLAALLLNARYDQALEVAKKANVDKSDEATKATAEKARAQVCAA